MFGLGYMEVGIILVVLVLLFGNKLPDVMKNLGRSVMSFKRGVKDECLALEEIEKTVKTELNETANDVKKTFDELKNDVTS